MKLEISREWCLQMADLERDHDVSACSPEIAAKARELATAHGHKDLDAIIVCEGGVKVSVWQFYVADAALSLSTP